MATDEHLTLDDKPDDGGDAGGPSSCSGGLGKAESDLVTAPEASGPGTEAAHHSEDVDGDTRRRHAKITPERMLALEPTIGILEIPDCKACLN